MGAFSTSWLLKSSASLALGVVLAGQACAQQAAATPAKPAPADEWRFQLTPYVWMAGLEGDIKPLRSGPTGHVSRSFSDILSQLDAAFFITGTARRGQLVLHGDISHASTSDRSSLPLGLTARASIKQSSATLLAGYSWLEAGSSSIDTMAGLRLWDIKAKLGIDGVGDVQSSASFTDPVLAARWRWDFAPRWSTIVYGDVGGFGVGSKSTWQGMGALNYQWSDDLFFSLGYRYLQVDYRRNGKRLDFNQSGPLLGATLRF